MDLFEELILNFDKGILREHLRDLRYGRADRELHKDENVSAELYLDSDKKLVLKIFGSKIPHEILYGDSTVENSYKIPLWFSAKTRMAGIIVNIEYLDPTETISSEDHLDLVIYPDFIEIHPDYQSEGASIGRIKITDGNFRGMLSVHELPFSNRVDPVTDTHPMFGKSEEVEVESYYERVQGVDIGLRLEDGVVRLGIDEAENAVTIGVIESLLHAISYIEGKPVHWRRFNVVAKTGLEVTRLYSDVSVPHPSLSPFNRGYFRNDLLCHPFEVAFQYFRKEESKEVAKLMYLSWYSQEGGSFAKALIICTVVESLVGYILKNKGDVVSIKEKESNYDILKRSSIKVLSEVQEIQKHEYFSRLLGVIDGSHLLKQKLAITEAAGILGIGISDEEIRAWEELRHKLAHGEFSISTLPKIRYVYNIVNKFMLGLMSYEGHYNDYAEKVWGIPKKFATTK